MNDILTKYGNILTDKSSFFQLIIIPYIFGVNIDKTDINYYIIK